MGRVSRLGGREWTDRAFENEGRGVSRSDGRIVILSFVNCLPSSSVDVQNHSLMFPFPLLLNPAI